VRAVLLSLLVAFALAEAGLRVFAKVSRYVPKGDVYYAPHYYLGRMLVPHAAYTSRAGSIHVNSRGFRGKEFLVPKPAGTFRIFALGGSSTFGHYPGITSDDATYPAQLERLLNAEKPDASVSRYEVVNAGVPGYSLRTSLQNLASRILFFEPDMIIICHVFNDLARYGQEEELAHPLQNQFVPVGVWPGLRDHLLGWSYAAQELRYTLDERLFGSVWAGMIRDKTAGGVVSNPWQVDARYLEVFRRDLRNLVAVAKANGVIPVLITEPVALTDQTDFAHLTQEQRKMRLDHATVYVSVPAKELYGLFQRAYRIIREVAEEEGALFIDVDAALPKTPEIFFDYVHHTDTGAALQAQVIHKALVTAWPGNGGRSRPVGSVLEATPPRRR
jgi:hypothetical protein